MGMRIIILALAILSVVASFPVNSVLLDAHALSEGDALIKRLQEHANQARESSSSGASNTPAGLPNPLPNPQQQKTAK
jgi:hypothetical protein